MPGYEVMGDEEFAEVKDVFDPGTEEKVAPFERAEKKPKKGMPPPDATSEPKSVVPYVG